VEHLPSSLPDFTDDFMLPQAGQICQILSPSPGDYVPSIVGLDADLLALRPDSLGMEELQQLVDGDGGCVWCHHILCMKHIVPMTSHAEALEHELTVMQVDRRQCGVRSHGS
jgi:hypothetical protein